MAIETPEYKIISKYEGFEVRHYSDMVIATTKVQADFKSSTSAGFRRVASYIFGGNNKGMKIAMCYTCHFLLNYFNNTFYLYFWDFKN